MDFIYLGEVKVIQKKLLTFLNVAEELEIDGLKRKEEKPDNTLNVKKEMPVDKSIESVVDNGNMFHETGRISTFNNSQVARKKSLYCNNCDFTSRFKANLNRHNRKLHGISHQIEMDIKNITCKYCGITETDKGNLDIHMQLEHKPN